MAITSKVLEELFSMQDLKYRDFQAKIIPNISKEKIIGVKIPLLRKYIKKLSDDDKNKYLNELNHYYYEENLIHMLILSQEIDINYITLLDSFLEYVDNWSVCDVPTCKFLYNDLNITKIYIDKWLNSEHVYKIRYAIKTIMTIFLPLDAFYYIDLVSKINNTNYYVIMMKAWFFEEALLKHYNIAIKYLDNNLLDKDTHNKAISKCVDSRLFTIKQKEYLKTLRRR